MPVNHISAVLLCHTMSPAIPLSPLPTLCSPHPSALLLSLSFPSDSLSPMLSKAPNWINTIVSSLPPALAAEFHREIPTARTDVTAAPRISTTAGMPLCGRSSQLLPSPISPPPAFSADELACQLLRARRTLGRDASARSPLSVYSPLPRLMPPPFVSKTLVLSLPPVLGVVSPQAFLLVPRTAPSSLLGFLSALNLIPTLPFTRPSIFLWFQVLSLPSLPPSRAKLPESAHTSSPFSLCVHALSLAPSSTPPPY